MTHATPTHWIGTDVGLVRERNEDAFLWLGPNETEGNGWLWLVADGMGGESAGDVASALLTTDFEEHYDEAIEELRNPLPAIERCVQRANRRIIQVGETYPDLRGLGTTFVALAYRDGKVYVAHVGDSRCYWLHRGELTVVTRDHTRAESLIELGHISRAEAEQTPQGSMLTRVVGRPKLEIDFGAGQAIPVDDDVFFLCSDGVWSVLPEHVIREALLRLHARDAVEALVELARLQWSDDNMTACVVRFAPPAPGRTMSREAFVQWAGGGISKLDPGRTMVLQAVTDRSTSEVPPKTNVSGIPRITAAVRTAEPAAEPIVNTATLSPDHMRALLAAVEAQKAAAAAVPGTPSSTMAFSVDQLQAHLAATQLAATQSPGGPASATQSTATSGADLNAPAGSTMAFSIDQMQALLAAASQGDFSTSRNTRPPLPTDQVGVVGDQTLAFSPDDLQRIGQAFKLPSSPDTTSPFSPQKVADAGNRSTLFFSADEISRTVAAQKVAAAAGHSRERTGVLTDDEMAQLRQAPLRERTAVLSREEIDELMEERPRSGPRLIGVFVGLGLAVALLAAVAYFFLRPTPATDEAPAGDVPPESGEAGPLNDEQVRAALAALPPVPPASPRAPDGVHDGDSMPYYRVEVASADGSKRVLRIDAHEVVASQLTALRAAVPDMEFVYANSSVALYEHLPCAGVHTTSPTAGGRVPVCAAPEAAEAYCAAVGRRLPSPDDWRAVLATAGGLIAPSRGAIWLLRADGAPPEIPTQLSGLVGVSDGLAEILRGSRDAITRGDLPLLMPTDPRATLAAVVERAGLLAQLRSRALALDEVPMLGFRCMVDEADQVAERTPAPAVGRSRRSSAARATTPTDVADAGAPEERRVMRDPVTIVDTEVGAPTAAPVPIATEAERRAETQREGGRRIELMDPVYLPATITEYENKVEAE